MIVEASVHTATNIQKKNEFENYTNRTNFAKTFCVR